MSELGCNFSGLGPSSVAESRSAGNARRKQFKLFCNFGESAAKLQNTSFQLICSFVSHAEPLLLQNAAFSEISIFPGMEELCFFLFLFFFSFSDME